MVESAIEILSDIADVRRREDVLQLAEGVVGRPTAPSSNTSTAAPAIPTCLHRFDQGHLVDDRTTRCVDEFAVGFIRSNSAGPISPLVRLLRTRWTVMTSASRNSVCLSTRVAPAPAGLLLDQVLAPGDHLHAEGEAYARDFASDVAQPDDAEGSYRADFEPMSVCHPPAFSEAASRSMPRMLASISDQVNSMVGVEL